MLPPSWGLDKRIGPGHEDHGGVCGVVGNVGAKAGGLRGVILPGGLSQISTSWPSSTLEVEREKATIKG